MKDQTNDQAGGTGAPVISSGITLPAEGATIPVQGSDDWNRAYVPGSQSILLKAVVHNVIDAALASGVIPLDRVGAFLDDCKLNYLSALHVIRSSREDSTDPDIVEAVLDEVRHG